MKPNEMLSVKAAEQMSPICNRCKNHIYGLKCKAFNIIPDDILFNKVKHDKPLKEQDNDIVFEEM